MNLVQLTPEGKIVMELAAGAKTYTELRRLTKLSDRWLSKKLKELMAADVVELRDNKYGLTKLDIIYHDPIALECFKARTTPLSKAKLIGEELSQDPRVLAVVLFGSIAKDRANKESDLDLVIITEGGAELNEEVYEVSFKYNVPIEATFISFEELLSHVQARTTFLLGVLEGYEVLYDRAGIENILSFLKSEVEERFSYDEGAGAWIRKNVPLTSTVA
ncbi:MAG: nucleotidyltransferase domain-containing protein [Candidatus Hodarchaeaceae archaeon]|nr:nucleotidyltransferase domain-containing protein [Candidatus Hodarchaeaceae archaeon]